MTAGRASQIIAEVAALGAPSGRATQIVGEVLASGSAGTRATQLVAEVAALGSPSGRATQFVGEVAALGTPNMRVSNFTIQVLIRSFIVTMPPVYPDLPGLTYPVVWRLNTFAQSEKASGGAEIDLALATAPIHEFDLTYSVLRNQYGVGSIEFKTLFGFYLALNGSAGRFLYKNPHDNAVTGQAMGTTDGTSTFYSPIVRTFGVGPNVGIEAVGYVDMTQPVEVYLDGVLQDHDSFTIINTNPVNQKLKFATAPAAGKAITMDFSFFYYCKFADPTIDFSEFMSNLFELQKVTLRSCRAGT